MEFKAGGGASAGGGSTEGSSGRDAAARDVRFVFALLFPRDPKPDGDDGKSTASATSATTGSSDGDAHEPMTRGEVCAALRAAGLATKSFLASDRKRVICTVGAPMARLLAEADRINYLLQLDPVRLREADVRQNKATVKRIRRAMPPALLATERGMAILNSRGSEIQNREGYGGHYGPYEHIYAKYEPSGPGASLYRRYPWTQGGVLREVDVLRLTISCIEGPVEGTPAGAGLVLEQLKLHGDIVDCFPLHEPQLQAALKRRWFDFARPPWQQPLDDVSAYFGEKVALYFAWLGHYTWSLMWPSFIGLVVWLHQATAEEPEVAELPLFGILLAVWASGYQETWKRREARQALKWGTSSFEQQETTRPEFNTSDETMDMPSPVTAEPIRWYKDPGQRTRRVLVSGCVILCLAMVVVVAVFSVFVLREWLVSLEDAGDLSPGTAGNIASVCNAIQIQVMNLIYGKVARRLNDWENHATPTQYEDSLIVKTFLFQAVNSYFALFYTAFIKAHLSIVNSSAAGCKVNADGDPDCISELRGQLAVIFITRLVVGNFQELALPAIVRRCNRQKEAKMRALGIGGRLANAELSRAERESALGEFTTFDNYAEQLIGHGFVTLFAVAFPLAPFLQWLNNLVEVHVDRSNALEGAKRVRPQGAQDLGSWYTVMDMLGKAAVLTNLALGVFVMPTGALQVDDPVRRVVLFLVLEHIVFGIKVLTDVVVADVPADVAQQLARQEYLVDKHVLGVAEDVVDAITVEEGLDDDGDGAISPEDLRAEFPVADSEAEAVPVLAKTAA